MYYTVDRIEGAYAVIEDDAMKLADVKLCELPDDIKEGDILRLENNIYIIDTERTRQVKQEMRERFEKMFLN